MTTHRRTTVAVVAAVAGVSIAVPVALASRDEAADSRAPVANASTISEPETSTPPTVPAGSGDWRTRIPADFRVDQQLPEPGGDFDRNTRSVAVMFCGHEAFAHTAVVDSRAAGASGPEYGESRDLRVFTDDLAAAGYVDGVADLLASCPTETVEGTERIQDVRQSLAGGEESLTVVQTFEQDGSVVLGANWWEVVRVGNAVLLTATGGEWMPGANLDQGIREHGRDIAPIVDAMCVFADGGC